MNKPIFITLEGVDGAGKTTHINFIQDYFLSKNIDFYITREPGGTPLGEKLRTILLYEDMDPLTETLLMFGARYEHIRNIIKPKLNENITVVSDRFTDATYAYQYGGKSVDISTINSLKNLIQKDLEPDLTFLFDLPINISIDRLNKTREKKDKFEGQNIEFHQAVRATYLNLARENKNRFHILDSTKDILMIQKEIKKILDTIFDD
jgi:dTMP kinase